MLHKIARLYNAQLSSVIKSFQIMLRRGFIMSTAFIRHLAGCLDVFAITLNYQKKRKAFDLRFLPCPRDEQLKMPKKID